MKKLLMLFAFLLCSLTTRAQYAVETLNTGLTYVVEGSTSNCINATYLDVSDQANVAMMMSFKLTNAGSGNLTLTFRPIVSKTYTPTHSGNTFTWVIASNGSTTVNATTNFSATGYGWIELVSIQNAANGGLTNIVTQYAVKKGK